MIVLWSNSNFWIEERRCKLSLQNPVCVMRKQMRRAHTNRRTCEERCRQPLFCCNNSKEITAFNLISRACSVSKVDCFLYKKWDARLQRGQPGFWHRELKLNQGRAFFTGHRVRSPNKVFKRWNHAEEDFLQPSRFVSLWILCWEMLSSEQLKIFLSWDIDSRQNRCSSGSLAVDSVFHNSLAAVPQSCQSFKKPKYSWLCVWILLTNTDKAHQESWAASASNLKTYLTGKFEGRVQIINWRWNFGSVKERYPHPCGRDGAPPPTAVAVSFPLPLSTKHTQPKLFRAFFLRRLHYDNHPPVSWQRNLLGIFQHHHHRVHIWGIFFTTVMSSVFNKVVSRQLEVKYHPGCCGALVVFGVARTSSKCTAKDPWRYRFRSNLKDTPSPIHGNTFRTEGFSLWACRSSTKCLLLFRVHLTIPNSGETSEISASIVQRCLFLLTFCRNQCGSSCIWDKPVPVLVLCTRFLRSSVLQFERKSFVKDGSTLIFGHFCATEYNIFSFPYERDTPPPPPAGTFALRLIRNTQGASKVGRREYAMWGSRALRPLGATDLFSVSAVFWKKFICHARACFQLRCVAIN